MSMPNVPSCIGSLAVSHELFKTSKLVNHTSIISVLASIWAICSWYQYHQSPLPLLITMPVTSLIITPLLTVNLIDREKSKGETERAITRWEKRWRDTINECQDRCTHWKIKLIKRAVRLAFLSKSLNSWEGRERKKKREGRKEAESECSHTPLNSVMLGEQQ